MGGGGKTWITFSSPETQCPKRFDYLFTLAYGKLDRTNLLQAVISSSNMTYGTILSGMCHCHTRWMTSSHMSLTVALRPFHIVFITCWWWWANVGVNFTALTYITATFSGKRHLLKIRWQNVVNWPEALGHEEFAAKRSCVVYTTKSQYLTSQINICAWTWY